jgi:hypothetical protein
MAKTTVMRLAGTPSLPAIEPVPRQHLAHNQRGAADFYDFRQAPPQAPRGSFQAPRLPPSYSSTLLFTRPNSGPPLLPLLLISVSPLLATSTPLYLKQSRFQMIAILQNFKLFLLMLIKVY